MQINIYYLQGTFQSGSLTNFYSGSAVRRSRKRKHLEWSGAAVQQATVIDGYRSEQVTRATSPHTTTTPQYMELVLDILIYPVWS